MKNLNLVSKMIVAVTVSLMALTGCKNTGTASSDRGENAISLYGTIDLDVANEYLKPQGLEAVEVAPGRALTGFNVTHFDHIKFPNGMVLKNYGTSNLPILANRLDGQVSKSYYFGEWVSDQWLVRLISPKTLGLPVAAAEFSFNQAQEGYPNAQSVAQVYLKKCPAELGCRANGLSVELKMGPSEQDEFEPTSEDAELVQATIGPMRKQGQTTSDFVLTGAEYRRPFDPARDEYFVAPGTVQGDLFKRGHFVPTTWSLFKQVSMQTTNIRTLK